MIDYFLNSNKKILHALLEHISLVGISMLISISIAFLIVLLVKNNKVLNIFKGFFSLIYSIPSLALLAILIPFSGLGKTTAIIALVVYAEFILVRNFSLGLDEVDEGVIEAAKGMGMREREILFKIKLPLATRSIISGIKIATTSTIGIATIATTINGGGLGKILFDGLRTMSIEKIIWGAGLCVLLCIVVNIFLGILEKKLVKY